MRFSTFDSRVVAKAATQRLCKNEHRGDLATLAPVGDLPCLIYDTQISTDHNSHLAAKVVHTWREQRKERRVYAAPPEREEGEEGEEE